MSGLSSLLIIFYRKGDNSKIITNFNYIRSTFKLSFLLVIMFKAPSLRPHPPKTHREHVPGYIISLVHTNTQQYDHGQIVTYRLGCTICSSHHFLKYCHSNVACFDLAGAVQNLHAVEEGQAVLSTLPKTCKIFCSKLTIS